MITQNKQINNFTNVRTGGWKLKLNSRFPADLTSKLHDKYVFDNVRGPFEEITASDFARTYKCSAGFSGGSETVYIKHYLHRSWVDFAKHLFRKNRARRAFDASLMLEKNSLNAPEIIALGRSGFGSIVSKSFLITKEVENGESIYQYLTEKLSCPGDHPPRVRHQFVRQLGDTIGRMHAARIFHGDLRSGNIFARMQDGNWEFFFLDNERTQKYCWLPPFLRIKNLVQINMFLFGVNNTDRMRFFKEYLKHNPQLKIKQKDLLRNIIAKTSQRLRGKVHLSFNENPQSTYLPKKLP